MIHNRIPVPIIAGPTAVGKTATAIALARQLDGEIISIDSRQVYQGLDVGTAKPTLRQRAEIRHHLIDILKLPEQISAGDYRRRALEVVAEISQRGKLPIFVGGSMLYIKALTEGIFKASRTDRTVRKQIRTELKKKGAAALYNRLMDLDPDYALKTHINDTKRITRALEIHAITGKPPSEHFRRQPSESPFPYRIFVLTMEREKLYECINERVDQMIANGLVEEGKRLLKDGFREALDDLQTLGYQEVISYLDGQCDHDEMVANIKRNTRRYAKRQLTWFRNQTAADWIIARDRMGATDIAAEIINRLKSSQDSVPKK